MHWALNAISLVLSQRDQREFRWPPHSFVVWQTRWHISNDQYMLFCTLSQTYINKGHTIAKAWFLFSTWNMDMSSYIKKKFFSSDVVWIQNESQMTHHNIVFKLFKTDKHNVLVLVLWTKGVTDYYIIYCRNNNLYLCLRCPLVYNIFNNN